LNVTLTVVAALLGLAITRPALAVGVTVEVTDAAEALLDSRLARRLITLELADVELPAVSPTVAVRTTVRGKAVRDPEVVFVRLLAEVDVLTVELWAQGMLTGERRIRVAGTEEHQARRVALACAELARHVREARLLERQRLLREHMFASVASGAPSYSIAVNLGVLAEMRAVWLPSVTSLLVGPRAGVWVRSERGFGLELHGSYYQSTDPESLHFWSELGLRPSWVFTFGQELGLSLGATAAAALLDVGSYSSIENATESRQTWNARVAIEGYLSYRLAPRTSLVFGPEVGLLLRDVPLQHRNQAPDHLAGLWFGFGFGAQWFL
jgi:hypothetical protein